MTERDARPAVSTASVGAADRQRLLNEMCRRVLQRFVGRKLTPTLMVEAEATLRAALDTEVRAGLYVLPDGLELDRVELGPDMRVNVLFKKAPSLIDRVVSGATLSAVQPIDADEVSYTGYARVSVARSESGWTTTNSLGVGSASKVVWPTEEPVETKPLSRFEAVAAEINDDNEE